ncbi:MAG: 5-oxoprolinase subunit PxpB [Metallibacterium sp.]
MPQWEALGESAVLLRWGHTLDAPINATVHAAAAALRRACLPGVEDIAPAYASLLLRFDLDAWSAGGTRDALGALHDAIEPLLAAQPDGNTMSPRELRVPVCYGGAHGPDLADVARHAGLSEHALIARHCAPLYRVAMLGFAPGFPYLLGLDATLHMPRRAQPRVIVPAGSVAIGGAQTGIYPNTLPGGWHLLGRTPWRLFDATREPACLLQPGDGVRFVAVTADEFAAQERAGP